MLSIQKGRLTSSYSSTLVTDVHQHCLKQALQDHLSEPDHIYRLVLSLIIHASKDDNHPRSMKTLESVFMSMYSLMRIGSLPFHTYPHRVYSGPWSGFWTSKRTRHSVFNGTRVLLSLGYDPDLCNNTCSFQLIWQYGGRHYKAKKWAEAADWYMSGSHVIFKAHSSLTSAKCFRKAALCHIEQREYALASTIIRRCPNDEASTHYVIFLTAVHQGVCSNCTLDSLIWKPMFSYCRIFPIFW